MVRFPPPKSHDSPRTEKISLANVILTADTSSASIESFRGRHRGGAILDFIFFLRFSGSFFVCSKIQEGKPKE